MENQEFQIIGAIKIKDGIFIGDEFAAQDLEFIVTNKVTHIINCAPKEVSNFWESIGVHYLNLPWEESEEQVLFDDRNEVVEQIYAFIENASLNGESCLVHSVRGQSRACCALSAYLMRRFKWSLYKTLEYLNSRRTDLEIRASFFGQLNDLEKKMLIKSSNWNEVSDFNDTEEVVIRNTFINAKNENKNETNPSKNAYNLKEVKRKILWTDENANKELVEYFDETNPASKKELKGDNINIRPIIKGSRKAFREKSLLEANKAVSLRSPTGPGPYLKMNKSSRSLMDENLSRLDDDPVPKSIQNISIANVTRLKPPLSNKENVKMNNNTIPFNDFQNNQIAGNNAKKSVPGPNGKDKNFARSSSLKYFKEENVNDISSHSEMPQNKGEIPKPVIHLTVNNFVNSPQINNNIITNNYCNSNNLNNGRTISHFTSSNTDNNFFPMKNSDVIPNSTKSSFHTKNEKNYDEEKNLKGNSKKDREDFLNSNLREKSPDFQRMFEPRQDNKDQKKKVVIRRPHDSVSPIPTRPENVSPANQNHKVMAESIYSKTLLKRFQVSLKEKPYEHNLPTSNNSNNNMITKIRENKDVSPIRAISDLRKNVGSGAERKRDISISQEDNVKNDNAVHATQSNSVRNNQPKLYMINPQNIKKTSNEIQNVNMTSISTTFSSQNSAKINQTNNLQNQRPFSAKPIINNYCKDSKPPLSNPRTNGFLSPSENLNNYLSLEESSKNINISNQFNIPESTSNRALNLNSKNLTLQPKQEPKAPRFRSSSPGNNGNNNNNNNSSNNNNNSNIPITVTNNFMMNSTLMNNNYSIIGNGNLSKPKWKF